MPPCNPIIMGVFAGMMIFHIIIYVNNGRHPWQAFCSGMWTGMMMAAICSHL